VTAQVFVLGRVLVVAAAVVSLLVVLAFLQWVRERDEKDKR
jgi:hypothetical protein